MPFERHDTEPDGALSSEVDDLQLPDELTCLAQQLRDDATFLATRFPPTLGDPSDDDAGRAGTTSPARRESLHPNRWRQRIWVLGSVAAALSLLVAVPGIIRFTRQSSMQDKVVVNGARDVDQNVVQQGMVDRDVLDRVVTELPRTNEDVPASAYSDGRQTDQPALTAMPAIDHDLSPELILQHASGPELEGLLDLLEYEHPQETTLSM